MTETTTGEVEGDSENVAVGTRNRQRTDSRSQRQGDTQQNVNFSNPDSMHLWMKLMEVASIVNSLVLQMDDLPNRVGRLERLEVVVKPGPEVIIRPAAHDTVNLSVRMIVIMFVVALFLSLALAVFLIYWQVANV